VSEININVDCCVVVDVELVFRMTTMTTMKKLIVKQKLNEKECVFDQNMPQYVLLFP
jgi:hypothetical protein